MLNDESFQKCIALARATIRKNGLVKSPSKKDKAFTIASVAGHCWEYEDGLSSYDTPYAHLPNKQYYIRKLPRWRDLSDLEKVFLTHEYICTNPDLVPVSFTFNIGELTAQTIKRNPNLNYPRDEATKAFKIVLNGHKLLFWMVEETRKKIHFHGVIGIPKSIATPDTYKAIAKALANTPMVKKRKESRGNKAVDVSTTYERKRGVEKRVDSGAVLYATKEWTNNNQSRFSISSELRKLTGDRHDKTIRLLKQKSTI